LALHFKRTLVNFDQIDFVRENLMQPSSQKALDWLHVHERQYGKKIIKIIGAANYHILMNPGDGMAAGKPMPVEMNGNRVWTLPIVLAPKCGGPAEVGSVFVDDKTLNVIGATANKQVMRNVKAHSREKAALL
jgi:hypothetical protein